MIRLITLLLASALPVFAEAPRPNIIFILCDDLGHGDLGTFYQNHLAKEGDRSKPWHMTPQLDKMAAEGMRLPHHYCPAPVCAPSRASLLTGKHQGHASIRDNQFDKELKDHLTLASMLKEGGYATAAIGKWGLQGRNGNSAKTWPSYPTKCGFDFFFGYVRHRDGHEHYPKEGPVRGKKEVWENDQEIGDQLDKCYTTDLFVARAKKWIVDHQSEKKDEPFFMYFAFDTPHAATQVPTVAYPEGGGLKGGLQWTGKAGEMINTAKGEINSFIHPDYADATWDHDNNEATDEKPWPDVYKKYATMVRRIDRGVGDLIQTLDDLGIGDNTLVVFTSDNGPSEESYIKQPFKANFFNSFGPLDGIKRDCLEGGVRVGALARWPASVKAGTTSNLPSQFHDWMPTFAELSGLAIPAVSDGVSLAPDLTGKAGQLTPQVYVEYAVSGRTPKYPEFGPNQGRVRNQMQMLRMGDLVGLRYNTKSHDTPFEIYDVVKDPGQLKNLADSKPEMQQQIKDKVLQMRRPEPSAKRPYDDEFVPSVSTETKRGLKWKAYCGDYPWVPNLSTVVETEGGTTPKLDLSLREKCESGAMEFAGYLKVEKDGEYTFSTDGKVDSVIRLHDILLIDTKDMQTENEGVATKIKLKAGLHPIRIWCLHTVKENLDLKWGFDGGELKAISDEAFCH